jgi:hypothetical protein
VSRGRARKHLRVLRGGAFNNDTRNVRCAVRNRNEPRNRNRNIGFRLVLVTFFNGAGIARRGREPYLAEAKNGGARSWPRRETLWPGK